MRIEEIQLRSEKRKALQLAWQVFQQFEAPYYEEAGVQNFYNFISDNDTLDSLMFIGAYQNQELYGMLAYRLPNHISLFFVSELHQGKGIGKELMQTFLSLNPSNHITVNSSPFAVPIYEKLGFHKVTEEQRKDGIRFTPMEVYR